MKKIRTPKLMVHNKDIIFVFIPDGTVFAKWGDSFRNVSEEFKHMQNILTTKITELDIEDAILAKLIYNKIYIFNDLVSLKEKDLINIEGINQVVFNKINESVIKEGLSLGMETKCYTTYCIK
jgi:DNA-directed RNA polymerase alpha subunit